MFKQFAQDDSIKNRAKKEVFRTIHEHGPLSKAELLNKTKLKQTTLSRLIDEWLHNRYIRESGVGHSRGGRPPVLYQVDLSANYIIGVDISRTRTNIVLTSLLFDVIDQSSFAMTADHTPAFTLNLVKEVIDKQLQQHHIDRDRLLGIGVGTVGPLDREKGMILQPEAFAAPGWAHVRIMDMLERAFSVTVLLENGANTAVLGEYVKSNRAHPNMLYSISGAGLRCGVMANGQLLPGKQGDVSAYGHMIIDVSGKKLPRCSCGNQGCLTSYISLDAILQQTVARIRDRQFPSLLTEWTHGHPEQATHEHVLQAIRQADRLTSDVLMESAHYYGIGLANMVNLLHPEFVILSGPLIHEHPHYYEKVVSTALRHVYITEKENVHFSRGLLKEDAAAIGAAMLVFHHFFK